VFVVPDTESINRFDVSRVVVGFFYEAIENSHMFSVYKSCIFPQLPLKRQNFGTCYFFAAINAVLWNPFFHYRLVKMLQHFDQGESAPDQSASIERARSTSYSPPWTNASELIEKLCKFVSSGTHAIAYESGIKEGGHSHRVVHDILKYMYDKSEYVGYFDPIYSTTRAPKDKDSSSPPVPTILSTKNVINDRRVQVVTMFVYIRSVQKYVAELAEHFELTSMCINMLHDKNKKEENHSVAAAQYCDKLVVLDSQYVNPFMVNWKDKGVLSSFLWEQMPDITRTTVLLIMTRRPPRPQASTASRRRPPYDMNDTQYMHGYIPESVRKSPLAMLTTIFRTR
jgi:hypothetical protein